MLTADREAPAVADPWPGGDPLMAEVADGRGGTPVRGTSRNTWVKFVARPRGD